MSNLVNKTSIDLEEFRTKNSKVFSGRDRGEFVRIKTKLEKIEQTHNEILFKVPEDIYAINPSFFLGLFGQSVRKFGEKKFKEKFQFICSEIVKADILIGIERALKETSVV
jgi:hypothetical protein